MRVNESPIAGVFELISTVFSDERGSFLRAFCIDQLQELGLDNHVSQCNLSLTRQQGTIRGMHFQRPPYAETKVVRCVSGLCFDVVVDLRANSSTFLKWWAITLDPALGNAVYIPGGCAHGFQALADDTRLLYTHSVPYTPAAEGGISPFDPKVAVDWPMPAVNLSDRDQALPFVSDDFRGLSP